MRLNLILLASITSVVSPLFSVSVPLSEVDAKVSTSRARVIYEQPKPSSMILDASARPEGVESADFSNYTPEIFLPAGVSYEDFESTLITEYFGSPDVSAAWLNPGIANEHLPHFTPSPPQGTPVVCKQEIDGADHTITIQYVESFPSLGAHRVLTGELYYRGSTTDQSAMLEMAHRGFNHFRENMIMDVVHQARGQVLLPQPGPNLKRMFQRADEPNFLIDSTALEGLLANLKRIEDRRKSVFKVRALPFGFSLPAFLTHTRAHEDQFIGGRSESAQPKAEIAPNVWDTFLVMNSLRNIIHCFKICVDPHPVLAWVEGVPVGTDFRLAVDMWDCVLLEQGRTRGQVYEDYQRTTGEGFPKGFIQSVLQHEIVKSKKTCGPLFFVCQNPSLCNRFITRGQHLETDADAMQHFGTDEHKINFVRWVQRIARLSLKGKEGGYCWLDGVPAGFNWKVALEDNNGALMARFKKAQLIRTTKAKGDGTFDAQDHIEPHHFDAEGNLIWHPVFSPRLAKWVQLIKKKEGLQ